jgi:hypothetical protein
MNNIWASLALGLVVAATGCTVGADVAEDDGEESIDGFEPDEAEGSDPDVVNIEASGSCWNGGVDVWDLKSWNDFYKDTWLFCAGEYPDLSKYSGGLTDWFWPNWDNRITRMVVNGQVSVRVWESRYYGGETKVYGPGRIVNYSGIWDNAVSSMKVRYAPRCKTSLTCPSGTYCAWSGDASYCIQK